MLKNYGFVWYARYYVSRWMILGGIAVMPAGRYRNDLIAMLWALSDHVHETIAVSNQESEKPMMIIDPPEGWLYGFPKELPDGVEDINVWLAENGYPQWMIDQFGGKVPCGFFYKKKDLL